MTALHVAGQPSAGRLLRRFACAHAPAATVLSLHAVSVLVLAPTAVTTARTCHNRHWSPTPLRRVVRRYTVATTSARGRQVSYRARRSPWWVGSPRGVRRCRFHIGYTRGRQPPASKDSQRGVLTQVRGRSGGKRAGQSSLEDVPLQRVGSDPWDMSGHVGSCPIGRGGW